MKEQRCEQSERVAQVCYDMHEELGIKWGDDPYHRINKLKAAERHYEQLLALLLRFKLPDPCQWPSNEEIDAAIAAEQEQK
jgi:hypothetical protein